MSSVLIVVDDVAPQHGSVDAFRYFFTCEVGRYSDISKDDLANADAVVLDLCLHRKEQCDAIRRIKAATGKPIVFLVSRADRGDLVQAEALGAKLIVGRSDPIEAAIQVIKNSVAKGWFDLVATSSPRLRAAVGLADHSLSEMACDVIEGRPLLVEEVERAASQLAEVVATEGLDAWLRIVAGHHSHTYRHSMMVSGYAVAFARHLRLSTSAQRRIGVAGLVHDLGKVRIPLSILDKEGALTDEERAEIKRHPVYSREILKRQHQVDPAVVAAAVRHHEFLDGTGYPDGLSGDDIPMPTRMMTICDIFSALTEKRAYKEAHSPRLALSMMVGMGRKLDSALLQQFRAMVLPAEQGEFRRRTPLPKPRKAGEMA